MKIEKVLRDHKGNDRILENYREQEEKKPTEYSSTSSSLLRRNQKL